MEVEVGVDVDGKKVLLTGSHLPLYTKYGHDGITYLGHRQFAIPAGDCTEADQIMKSRSLGFSRNATNCNPSK